MIPKKIHYVWVGPNEKPASVQKILTNWSEHLPDYQIIEWNEHNFRSDNAPIYVQQAIQHKKWAFVSDYIRLWVLYKFGGIYLDTDVKVIKNFDGFLGDGSFIGRESEEELCTAVIGAEPNAEWIKSLLSDYRERTFVKPDGSLDLTPNSKYINQYLVEANNRSESKLNIPKVYSSDYFSPKSFYRFGLNLTQNTTCIHQYDATWKSPKARSLDFVLRLVGQVFGESQVFKLKKYVGVKRSENNR